MSNKMCRLSRAVTFAFLMGWIAPGAASAAPAASASRDAVPFIENDYAKALAEARARDVPLFIDSWATWCHTCRSMRAFVFTDPALTSRAGQFVWLALDVEKEKNAPVRKKYPAAALPTFFIVDPDSERVALRWVGGMTVAQVNQFLDDGRKALTPDLPSETALARGDRLFGAADYKGASEAYAVALPELGGDPATYARVAEAQSFALSMIDDNAAGVKLAQETLPRLGRTNTAATIAARGLSFAVALPESVPDRAARISEFEKPTRELLEDRSIPLADDDRSGMYIALLEARQALGDSAGARKVCEEWAAFLEGAAARAQTPDQRAVFDSHRLSAYLELGQPEKAVPFLQQSEKAAPGDYNPPYRLALAYNAMKRWDDALAATERSLARAYGPRKLLIYRVRSDAYAGKGDKAAARKTLDEALAYARALPDGQRSETAIASLEKKRDAIQ